MQLKTRLNGRMKWLLLVIPVLIACSYLSLKHLDNTYFWDDEALVGIIANNFLNTGSFTGWDGRNLFTYRNGILLDAQLRIINPPLEYLVTAGSFWLFGVSTWAGRLPFVVAGLLSVVVFALLLRHTWKKEVWLWGYTLGGLALSPALVLNIRQCRYYALALLFSLCTFAVYRLCLQTKRWRDFTAFGIFAALLFYSNYLLGIPFLLALGMIHLIFHRRAWSAMAWKKMALTMALFCLATVPYAFFYRIWERPDSPTAEVWYLRKLTLLLWNLRDVNLIGYFPWLVAGGLTYVYLRDRKQHPTIIRTAGEWLIFSMGFLVFLALFSPQQTKIPGIADVRYLIPVLPFLTGLTGICLWGIHQRMPIVAVLLFVVSLSTNILTLTPFNREFRWLLPAYLKEIHQDYPTANREVARFLQRNTQQDELILTFPLHTNYPIMFYTGDKLLFCCTLDNNTRLPRERLAQLHAPLFIAQHRPDWFVAFGYSPMTVQLLAFFSQSHQDDGSHHGQEHYRLVEILDVYWDDTNRPELPWHSFGAKTDFDRRSEAVYVFKRVADGGEKHAISEADVE
jgi:4-amino-4-deoxy-L-arabinose transferase-like glycosyltransferase